SVLVNYAAANRDPREFDRPDECIIDRETNRHLGFGAGMHRCLGAHFARLELRVGIEQVIARLPELSLAVDESELDYRGNSVTRGFRSLPVRFEPGRRRVASTDHGGED